VFERQPVSSILSFTGAASGVLDTDLYALYHPEWPLALGRSTAAGDYLQVTLDTIGIPSSTPITVTDETHVVLDNIEYLNNFGVNPLTVVVKSNDLSITYDGPYAPDHVGHTGSMYPFVHETPDNPLGITLTSGSTIVQGQTLKISYSHDENFSVKYETNAVVGIAQNALDDTRHITADVVAKDSIPVSVDLTGTVVLKVGATASTVDSNIRTALARLFGQLALGTPLRQSDVIEAIDSVTDVSYVVVPLTKMTRADGSLVVAEALLTDETSDSFEITTWSTPTVHVYLLKNPLESATLAGGGPLTEFRGVFQDEVQLTHLNTAPNAYGLPLNGASGKAFIIGNTGLNIPGYSDNATLAAAYPLASATELAAKRVEITANRVMVSLPLTETPEEFDYTVTYVVGGDTGVKNIDPGPIEYLVMGNVELTYDEDRSRR
jgi:hypothetical protein